MLLNGQRIDGKKPFEVNRLGLSRSFQITNIFPKLSVFENLRCGVLWSLGYRYTFLRFLSDLHDANERAEELMEQSGSSASATCWRSTSPMPSSARWRSASPSPAAPT